MKAGNKNNYKPAVEQLVNKGPKLIEELLINTFNVPFERDSQDNLIFTSEAAHSNNRIIHCKDTTGYNIHNAVIAKIKNTPPLLSPSIYTVSSTNLRTNQTNPNPKWTDLKIKWREREKERTGVLLDFRFHPSFESVVERFQKRRPV